MFLSYLLSLLKLVRRLYFVFDGCAVALERNYFVSVGGSFDLVHHGVSEACGQRVENRVFGEVYYLRGSAHHDFDVEQKAFKVFVEILIEVAFVVVDGVDSALFAYFLLQFEENDEDVEDGLHGVLELELRPVLHVIDGFFFGFETQLAQILLQDIR